MKKKTKCNLYLLLTVVLVLSLALMREMIIEAKPRDGNVCSGKTLDWLRQHVPIPNSTIASRKPVDGGLCEIILKTGPQYIPVYVNDDFVMAGEMFKDKIQITENTINQIKTQAIQENLESLDKATAFTYTPAGAGTDSPTVYMITDPLCPYCSRALENIQDIMDKHQAILKTILYTVHGEKGEEKSRTAICQRMDLPAYVETDWKTQPTTPESCDRYTELHRNTLALVETIGIRGVPVFVLDDGRMVAGANIKKLEDLLTTKTNKVAAR